MKESVCVWGGKKTRGSGDVFFILYNNTQHIKTHHKKYERLKAISHVTVGVVDCFLVAWLAADRVVQALARIAFGAPSNSGVLAIHGLAYMMEHFIPEVDVCERGKGKRKLGFPAGKNY